MERGKLTRRGFLRLLAAAATGAIVAACAPAAPKVVEVEKEVPVERVKVQTVVVEKEVPAKPAEKVELEFWHSWGGAALESLQRIVDNFNMKNPGIYVHRLHVSNMQDKLMTAIAAGTPPDLGVCCVQYPSFFARGVITPLDDFIEASDVIKREDYFECLWESMTWQGKTYGVPACECGPRYGLYYDRALLEEAGLSEEDLPRTWEQMLEWHEKLTKFDEAGNLVHAGLDPLISTGGNGPMSNIPLFWACSYGFHVWDEKTYTFHFDDERFVRALEIIKRFYDFVGVEKMYSNRQKWEGMGYAAAPIASGAQAMLISGYYAAGHFVLFAPEKDVGVTWAPTPSEREGVKFQSLGGHPIYIPEACKHKEAAFKFIEEICLPESIKIMFDAKGWIGGRKVAYDRGSSFYRYIVDKYPLDKWNLDSMEAADEIWRCPVIPIQAFVNQQRASAYEAVIYGDKTPEEAAKDMQEACTKELLERFPELVG